MKWRTGFFKSTNKRINGTKQTRLKRNRNVEYDDNRRAVKEEENELCKQIKKGK